MDVNVIHSNRKTVAISVNSDLSVTVKAPQGVSEKDIYRILEEKKAWICTHLEQVKRDKARYESSGAKKLTYEDINMLADKAIEVIPKRVKYFAPIVGVTYGRITIRNQKTRWGSCSAKGNLNFNCLLMLTPPKVLDYVVVHELCHRKEMNHSKSFWTEVEKVMPDYKEAVRWLKEEGRLIMQRL